MLLFYQYFNNFSTIKCTKLNIIYWTLHYCFTATKKDQLPCNVGEQEVNSMHVMGYTMMNVRCFCA
jgi:hypothetical protein